MTRIPLLRILVCAALAAVISWSATSLRGQAQPFRIIVHPDVKTSSLPLQEVSDYFLKKTTRWKDDGAQVYPVDLDLRDVRESFSTEVHGRSVGAIKKYWQRQIFTGRDTPPPEKTSDRDVIQYVESTRGAIGYVSASADLSRSSVKTVQLQR